MSKTVLPKVNETTQQILSNKIEQIASNKIEQIANNKIEQTTSETVDVSKTIEQNSSKTVKSVTVKYFFTCIDNLLAESISLTTPLGINTAKQIYILATYQLIDTNRTRIEHLSLSAVTIGSKYLVIGSARLGDKIVLEAKQASTSIDRQGHGYQDFPFGSRKSGDGMSVDFGRNANEKLELTH